MINFARVMELGDDGLIYARYIKPMTPKAATSRKFWKVKERSFPVENPEKSFVKVGDYVEISIKTGLTIGAAFLVFMVPLILFALFYGIAGSFWEAEGLRAAAGLVGLGLGLVLPAFINLLKKDKNYPRLEKVLTPVELKEKVACETDCASCGGCG